MMNDIAKGRGGAKAKNQEVGITTSPGLWALSSVPYAITSRFPLPARERSQCHFHAPW